MDRRDFIKLGLVGLGALAFRPLMPIANSVNYEEWPLGQQLGRNCVGGIINVRAKPSGDANSVAKLYEDSVLPWVREVIGVAPAGEYNRKWVETPQGYIYAPSFQPVKNNPNKPLSSLPGSGDQKGMWAEVTVPYVDLIIQNPPARSPWLKEITKPRLYYSQVMWIDDIMTDSQGKTLYRVNEKAGTYGDIFWASANGFRPITKEEIAPISPDVEDKRIVVDINHQVLTCYENNQEVYFCQISSGAKFDYEGKPLDDYSTPPGKHPIWRKVLSIHMSSTTTGASGYDTPGISWTSIFDVNGAAIHSTFWHNDFGTPRSHGCVNASAEDAKWIFRWTTPKVSYNPGDLTVSMPGGTVVDVVEA